MYDFEPGEAINLETKQWGHATIRDLELHYATRERERREEGLTLNEVAEMGFPQDDLQMYPAKYSIEDRCVLYRLGIQAGELDTYNTKVLDKIVSSHAISIDGGTDYCCIGTGTQGVIILDLQVKQAYKFSEDSTVEIDLLSRLRDHHGVMRHVVNLADGEFEGFPDAIPLQYIVGESLERLCERKVFSVGDVLKYGQHILRGLEELRACDIYHRDLCLSNIMIDDDGTAIIIDLGKSQEPVTIQYEQLENGWWIREIPPTPRRRFGGENDLQSLGQILYKMVVGSHIFNPTVDKATWAIPDVVLRERERAYKHPRTLERRLKQVDKNVDGELNEIIKFCLRSDGSDSDYMELDRRFADAA